MSSPLVTIDPDKSVARASGLRYGVPYAFTPIISSFIMTDVSSGLSICLAVFFMTLNSVVYYAFFNKIKPP